MSVVVVTFLPLAPVIDQTIHRSPLEPWAAVGFIGAVLASGYLAFRRSPWVLAALAFAVPFAAYRDIGQTTVTIEKCLLLGTFAGLLLSRAPLLPRGPAARRVLFAASLILATILISLAHAAGPLHVAREFLKQLEYLMLFWCAATLTEHTLGSKKMLYLGVGGAALIVSTLAVSQGLFGGSPSGLWVNGHPIPRVVGTLEGPNQLAGFLEAALPVLWLLPVPLPWLTGLRSYTLAACAAAMMLTFSRAGVAVAALAYLAMAKMNSATLRFTWRPTLAGAVLGLMIALGWFAWWAQGNAGDVARFLAFTPAHSPGGVGDRHQLWRAALALFSRSPLTGVGAGNFEFLLPTVGLSGVQTQASSLWLQTLAEQGVLGLAALTFFAVVALRETYRLRWQQPLAFAAFLALASLLAHQLVDDLFFYPKVAAVAWLLLGAGTAAPLEVQARPASADCGGALDSSARAAYVST